MRCPRFAFLLVFAIFAKFAFSQQTTTPVQRDPQAIAILQQSVAAMASTAPADSSAIGSVIVVEGSTTQGGSIQILTLGADQTSETITLPNGPRSVVYSNGEAKETIGTQSTYPPLQLVVSDQCPDFPLPLLLSALNNPDFAFRYVGVESLNGNTVHHIQLWNTFGSKPLLQALAPFSMRDIWFDSTSLLPIKLFYSRRAGGGAVPGMPVEIVYSNYTNVSGVLYPFQICKSYNGTPWATINISSVSFNTGLTNSQFQVK